MQDTITREEYKPEQPFIPTDKRGVNKSSHVGGNGENVGSENETPLEDGKIVPLELPEEQQNSETPVPFPIHCLPVGVGDFVKEVARDAMIPESMVALTALGILGASLGAGIKLRTYRGTLCGNLFILMAVSSGIGKDLALGKVKAPLSELDSERSKHWFSEELPKLKSESKLIRREIAAIEKGKTEAVGKLPELEKELAELERLEKKEPFLMISDATREALVMALATQPGETVALVTSEGRGALSNITGRYARGISDADIYCGGYSGTPVTVIRVGRESVRLDAPCLTSLLMTQPDNFAKVMADPEMVESGYLPRNLIHDPKAERQDIPDFHESASPRILQRWSGLIQILVKSYRDRPRGNEVCAVVEPSPEALCAVKDYYNEIAKRSRKDGDLVDIGIYTARWAENACKIALILHAAEHAKDSEGHQLSLSTAKNALTIMRWCAAEQLLILEGERSKKRAERAERLIEIIRQAGEEGVTIRNLARSHGFPSGEVVFIRKTTEKFEINKIQGTGGGRPSLVAKILGK